MAIGGRIDWDESALAELMTSPGGGVARMLQGAGEKVTQEAKRLAPTSPHGSGGRSSGYLRSQIGLTMGADGDGLYVDIATPATTASGSPYGLFQEVGTSKMAAQPHIRPALDVLR
jgi:HK97 gp10 family phage protein